MYYPNAPIEEHTGTYICLYNIISGILLEVYRHANTKCFLPGVKLAHQCKTIHKSCIKVPMSIEELH
jgi:hypothetical protein